MRLSTVQKLVEAIHADPGVSVRGLGRALGITPRAIRYHLLRLQSLGLLERRWAGGRRVLLLDAKASLALRRESSLAPGEVEEGGTNRIMAGTNHLVVESLQERPGKLG
jgi:DNA-binding transcriptional ArsR family regulator